MTDRSLQERLRLDTPVQMAEFHNGDSDFVAYLDDVKVADQERREAAAEIERQAARIAELEGVVGRLPKTADGVPFVPGGDCVWQFASIVDSKAGTRLAIPSTLHRRRSRWDDEDNAYSTEAAARAAMQQEAERKS
jgi:hypothetical protein